jgi:hypothetical protein
MHRIIYVFILGPAAVWGICCGSECNTLSGSVCQTMDCSFDTVRCTRYEPPNHALRISYERTKTGREYTAVVLCELYGIEKVEGLRLEGQDFLDRCSVYSPGAPWPDLKGIFCKFEKGGDRAGKNLSGKCGFDFVSGTKATAEFCCKLESADL